MPDAAYMIDATLRVPHGLWQRFQEACIQHQTYPSEVLREAMEDALERWDVEKHLAEIRQRIPAIEFYPWSIFRPTEEKG